MQAKRPGSSCSTNTTFRNERGVVLTTSLIVLAVLSLMGATAILTTITDTQIASNLKYNALAFYNAEAGINYTLAVVQDLIANGSLSLTGSLPKETLTDPITAPAGFSFDPIDTFTRIGSSKTYQFQVTGRSGTSRVTLRVDFRRDGNTVNYGLFGNQMVELQESSQVFSYDSDVTPNPTALDATGEGDMGSNEEVRIHHTVYIDGHVSLGTDELGNPGSYSITGDPTDNPSVTGGWPPANVDRVNPDPLGAINGDLADEIDLRSNNNDNLTNASPPITGNKINVNAGDPPLTLHAGNFYFTSITLNKFSELKIDTSSGAVNIYLTGAFNAKQYSSLSYTSATVSPSDFTIYSNDSAPIVLSHSDAFKGMIYAPYASVEIKNGGGFTPSTVYGLIWANSGTLYSPSLFYFDTKLKSKLETNAVSIVSWKEIIN